MVSEWIRALYRLQPHAIMPAPLAAVEQDVGVCDEYFRHGPNGEVVAAVVASDSNVELVWAREGCLHLLVGLLKEVIERNRIKFLAMNWTRYPIRLEHFGFRLRGRYFRLIYNRHGHNPKAVLSGFGISSYRHQEDDEMALELIRTCYAGQGIAISLKELAELREKRFFDPALWFWIVKQNSEEPCALAVSHHDTEVGEGWLDWVQVLPEFRGRGLGRMLVGECVSRLRKAKMITVSGSLDNPHRPSELYRKCGFSEHQEWFIMERSLS